MGIYERIRGLCKVNGITITGLERKLGFAKGSLCKIDNNKPSFERMSKLANALGVSMDYLMTGKVKSTPLTPYSQSEYDMVSDILRRRGLEVSHSDNETVIHSDGIVYTVDKKVYFDFCDDLIGQINTRIDELLQDKIISIKIILENNEVNSEKIKSFAQIIRDDTLPIAAHASQGATAEDVQKDIMLVEQHKKGDKIE